MTINPICNKCGQELKEFGGILFSPPNKEELSKKYHLCVACYKTLIRDFSLK